MVFLKTHFAEKYANDLLALISVSLTLPLSPSDCVCATWSVEMLLTGADLA